MTQLLAVTILTSLQRCVKLHHLSCNKRPGAGQACPCRQRGRASATAGENGAEQPGRATDTTTTNPNNNGLIDGADKRLAQSTQHVCTLKHTHTRDTHTKHLPHNSLSTRLLLPLSPHFFFFFFFFPLCLFSPSWSSCSESWILWGRI